MLEFNKKVKRILSLAVVCLMLTPIVSFATTDVNTGTEGTDAAGTTGTDAVQEPQKPVESDEFKDLTEEEQEAIKLKQRQNAKDKSVVLIATEEIDGHRKVGENSNYEFYVKDKTLSVIIRDKVSGSVLRSEPVDFVSSTAGIEKFANSGIAITVIKKDTTWKEVLLTERYGVSEEDVTVNITDIENGISAHVNYQTFGIEFDVIMTLDDEGLHVNVPLEETLKENNENYKMNSLFVLPMFGATKLDYRDGYMFIPDGSGILINLEDFEGKFGESIFATNYYGNDIGMAAGTSTQSSVNLGGRQISFSNSTENMSIPVFGMINNDNKIALLGVVDEGAESAVCIYTLNTLQSWNLVSSRFVVRDTYEYPTDTKGTRTVKEIQPNITIDNANVTYLFASGDDADYAGLAVKYREKLQKEGVLTQKDMDFKVRTDFLGVDKENFLVFKRNVTMTTVEDVRNIIEELNSLGVDGIFSTYRGWQKGGIYSLPVKEYKADRDIGGTKELTKLINDYKDSNIDIFLEDDAQRLYPDMVNSAFISLEGINKQIYERRFNGAVLSSIRYTVPEYTIEYTKKFASDIKKQGLNNISIKGIGNRAFTYSEDSDIYVKKDTIGQYTSLVNDLKNDGITISMDSPNRYMWNYMDVYTQMQLGSSGYVYATQEVPFLALVLKGSVPMYSEYVNFEADKTKFFLKLVENGVYPSFYITEEDPSYLQNTDSNDVYSSKYSLYKDTIVEYYTKLKQVNDKVTGAYIVDHEQIQEDISVTTYDNGVKVYVNYSESAVTIDGLTIDAESYKVGEANE